MKNENNENNQTKNNDPQSTIPDHQFGYELGRAVTMAATNGARESSMVSTPICQDLVKDKIAFLEGLKEKPELVGGKPGQIAKNQIGEMVGLMKAFSRIGQALDGANSIYGAYEVHGQFKCRRSELTDKQRADLPRLIANFSELVKFTEYATRPNVEGANVIWRRLKPSENSSNPRRDVAIKTESDRVFGRSRSKAPAKPSNPYNVGDVVKVAEDCPNKEIYERVGYDMDGTFTVSFVGTEKASVGMEQIGKDGVLTLNIEHVVIVRSKS